MRFLFSSIDDRLVEEMGKRLDQAGVLCEVRYRPAIEENPGSFSYKELWVRIDRELQWAISLLAMHCEVGRN